jgi:methionyl-tRNA formyltransferase
MKKTSSQFIFFGSGPIAAESLKLLVQDFIIEKVVTKPNLPHYNHKLSVSDIANKYSIECLELVNNNSIEHTLSQSFNSKIGLIIDYGIILSEKVINYFPLGIVNSHFSLLPQWRGPDPISFAILSGQRVTGVSLMLIRPGIDDGPLLAQNTYPLSKTASTPILTKELIKLSHKMLVNVLPQYIEGKIIPYEQDDSVTPTYSRKLTKEDGLVQWSKPATQIEREVRAYVNWPKSYTKLNQVSVIITAGRVVNQSGMPGNYVIDHKHLMVYCGQQAFEITMLKPIGKPVMSAEAFLAGYSNKLSI